MPVVRSATERVIALPGSTKEVFSASCRSGLFVLDIGQHHLECCLDRHLEPRIVRVGWVAEEGFCFEALRAVDSDPGVEVYEQSKSYGKPWLRSECGWSWLLVSAGRSAGRWSYSLAEAIQ